MLQHSSLEELRGLAPAELPRVCNLYIRVDERPFFVADRGGRWHVRVSALSGGAKALIAVHRDPAVTGLALHYRRTSPELLEIFDRPEYRKVLGPGEVVLVQCEPKVGREGLCLNVETVLIARPFATFGRQQIDFGSPCERKSYLSVVKAPRKAQPPESGHWGTVGGNLAHEGFFHLATRKPRADVAPDQILTDALSPPLLAALVYEGIDSTSGMRSAVQMASTAVSLALQSESVGRLLAREERWRIESDALNNGVSVSPDLLGEHSIVEFKTLNPEGAHYSARRTKAQIESYLAWAMVQFGVDAVLDGVSGHIVHLHRKVPEADRVIEVKPDRAALGYRIRNRHKLLALSGGAWLPATVTSECDRCEFSEPSRGTTDEGAEAMPAVCTYHCQVERHWPCWSATRSCPLLDVCDQFDRYEEYERVDHFNRLRQDLHDEEEQVTALEQVLQGLVEGGFARDAGIVLEGFHVERYGAGQLALRAPPQLAELRFANPGELFLAQRGKCTGLTRFRKLDKGLLVMDESRPGALGWSSEEVLTLRAIPASHYPAREQLHELERQQRSGQAPVWLRGGKSGERTVQVRECGASLDAVSPVARIVVVDVPGRGGALAAARDVLSKTTGRVLVIKAPEVALSSGSEEADLDAPELFQTWSKTTGPLIERVEQVVEALKQKRVWFIPRDHLLGGTAARLLEGGPRFDDVIVLGAGNFPLLGLGRCLEFGRRLILIGDSRTGGPRAESPKARESALFQNPLRLLVEVGKFAVPGEIGQIDVVRWPLRRACAGLTEALGLVAAQQPAELAVHQVASAPVPTAMQAVVEIAIEVAPSNGNYKILEVELEPTEAISYQQLRLLLRAVTAPVVERLSASERDRLVVACGSPAPNRWESRQFLDRYS